VFVPSCGTATWPFWSVSPRRRHSPAKFHRPDQVTFRLVRGPVPHVTEEFLLDDQDGRTGLTYRGEMAADLWRLGQWWANVVARRWETTVAGSLGAVKQEAERRARSGQH
jgi:hypothetical protein